MSVTVEKSLRVYNDRQGVSILVCVHRDGPEFGIECKTTDQASKDWFGEVSLAVCDKEFAKALGHAILEMAEEMQE